MTHGAASPEQPGQPKQPGRPERPAPPAELNGMPVTAAEAATLAVLTYGHFSSMLVDDESRVKGLTRHLERLVRDCELVFGKVLDPGLVRASLRSVAASRTGPTMLRATVFDPTLLSDRSPSVLVTTRAAPTRRVDGDGGPDAGVRLRTVNYARELPTVKHLGFFGPLRQRHLAQRAGYDDPLFISRDLVCEGPTWNVAVLIGDELLWPDDECLPGVTRMLIQQVLEAAGVAWATRSVTRVDLADAQAAFITSSGIGIRPVTSVDDVVLPGAPDLLGVMRRGYLALTGEAL